MKCSHCGGQIIVDGGEWVCESCGFISEDQEGEYQSVRPKGVDRLGLLPPMHSFIDDYIKPKLGLNDGICEKIKYLFDKYKAAYSHRNFYISEYVCACTFIAILQTRIPQSRKRRGKWQFRIKGFWPEQIAKKLNPVFRTVVIGSTRYRREVRPDRIMECAKFMNVDGVKIPDSYATISMFNDRMTNVEGEFPNIIECLPQLGKDKRVVFKKVDRTFRSSIKKSAALSDNVLLRSNGKNGHDRVIAAAFIYKTFKNKLTFRQVKNASGCGNRSLQKVLRLLDW